MPSATTDAAGGLQNGDVNGHYNGYANGTSNGSSVQPLDLTVLGLNSGTSMVSQSVQHTSFFSAGYIDLLIVIFTIVGWNRLRPLPFPTAKS